MINASRLKVQSEYVSKFGYFWSFLLAVYWATLLLNSSRHNVNAGVKVLILLSGFSMAVGGWRGGRSLADGARVLSSLQMPRTLWRDWLLTTLNGIGMQWLVTAPAGMLALVLSGAEWTWSSAACLFSTLMVLSMIASLSQYGVWHWAWPWCIALTLCLSTAFVSAHELNQFMHVSSLWQLPIAMSWPLMLAGMAWRWRDQPPKGVAIRGRLQFNPLRGVMNYIKRYTTLDLAKQRSARFKNKNNRQMIPSFFLALFSLIFVENILREHRGNHVGLLHIGLLLYSTIFTYPLTVCKDLHWRRMLSPNGFPRGGLGWHIILSTSTFIAMFAAYVLAIFGLFFIVSEWAGYSLLPSSTRIFDIVSRYSTLPLELILGICIAVVWRAMRRPILTYLIAMFTLGIGSLAAFWFFKTKVLFDLFDIGPAYVGSLLIAIGIMIWIANRLWTTQRLLPFLVAGAVADEDTVMGGRWFTWPGKAF